MLRKGLPVLLALVALPIMVAACGDEAKPTSTPTAGEPSPTPNIQATIAALERASLPGTPTPTPVPPGGRAMVLAFAQGQGAVTRDWDQFHREFDAWRESLSSCDASAMDAKLRGFAGEFAAITEEARSLPRTTSVRALADTLIEAAEGEERAIRTLRDTWLPDDPRAFEELATERSAAQALQKGVEDELGDLLEMTSASSQLLLNGFPQPSKT